MKNLVTAAALIFVASSSVRAQATDFDSASRIMFNNMTPATPPLDRFSHDERRRNTKAIVAKLAMNQPVESAATPSAEKYAGGDAKSVAAPPRYSGPGGDKTSRIGPSKAMPRNISPDEFNWMQGGGG